MNRTTKDTTFKRFHYATYDRLRGDVADLAAAFDFGRRLWTLRRVTLYAAICKAGIEEANRFAPNLLP